MTQKALRKKPAFIFLLGCVLLLPLCGFGQNLSNTLTEFNSQRIALNTNSMYILSGWAITNIAIGTHGFFKTEGRLKYFHQMNAAWNVVNLSIAGLALYGYAHAHPNSFSLAESIAEAHNIENILLLNIGLDAAYIAGGGFLWERGLRKINNRLTGYGQSLVLQGGFLMMFDMVLYFLNHSHNHQLNSILQNLSIHSNQLSVTIPL